VCVVWEVGVGGCRVSTGSNRSVEAYSIYTQRWSLAIHDTHVEMIGRHLGTDLALITIRK
jgi:hypothetical protein